MKIGDLRQRITLQQSVKTPDGHKGFTEQWQDLATMWAAVEPLTGREYFSAHQIKAEVTHRVKVRYRTDATTKMRFKLGDRALLIESIIDIKERREMLEILCREEK
jgi:SPP1 family predicted phage head-tail adaptor